MSSTSPSVRVLAAVAAVLALAATVAAVSPATASAGELSRRAQVVPRVQRLAATSPQSTVRAMDATSGLIEIAGANRYATAAAHALAFWSFEETTVVYVASGRGHADALAAGGGTPIDPLGPILLTEPDRLPAETREVLEILQPCFVVAMGGPAAIGPAVRAELADLAAVDEPFCAS